jgi:hypothetical protein
MDNLTIMFHEINLCGEKIIYKNDIVSMAPFRNKTSRTPYMSEQDQKDAEKQTH